MVSSIVVVNLELEEMKWVGRDSTGGWFLRLKCDSFYEKFDILKRAKDLRKQAEYKGMCINPTLTKIQREADKAIREEVKALKAAGEQAYIYRWKIVGKSKNVDIIFF